MPNLYQLGDDYLMLAQRLADTTDEDGVIDESLLPVVTEARELVEHKATSVACVIKELMAYKTHVDEELARLTQMSKTLDDRVKYLKTAISNVLQKCGVERIETTHATISFRKSTQTCIDCEDAIPDEYIKVEIKRSPDKNKIKTAINDGKTVPGAYIAECKNIQIK